MREEGSLFGGEVSGHYYFRDFYCADSGTIPALLMLELLSRTGAKLSELLRALPRALLHLRRDQLRGHRPGRKMEEIAERYGDARQERLDGISIDYDDWHFNVRPSNTEPLLRLCLESLVSREDMERRRDEVLALIRRERDADHLAYQRGGTSPGAAPRNGGRPSPGDPNAVSRWAA